LEITGTGSRGQLQFFGPLAHLRQADAFARFLEPLRQIDWVVYAKPPGPL